MKSPLLPVAGCYAAGIFLARLRGTTLPDTLLGVPLLLGASATCLLAGLILLRSGPDPEDAVSPARPNWRAAVDHAKQAQSRTAGPAPGALNGRQAVSGVLALSGFVLAGAASFLLFAHRFPPQHVSRLESRGLDLNRPVGLEGRIVSGPHRTPSGLQFDLEASSITLAEERVAPGGGPGHGPISQLAFGKVRINVAAGGDFAALDMLHLNYGDSVQAVARLRRPRVYHNPGNFDYRSWLESIDDVYWTATVTGSDSIERRRSSGASDIGVYTDRIRRRMLEAIDRMYPPWTIEGRDGAVLKAALLGDRSAIDSDTIEGFRKAGLYHLLVIAGLHVGLLAMLLEMLLRVLRISEPWRALVVLLFLVAYALLVEQRAPTLRATVMISVYVLARLFYREHAALNAIGLAALVLLIARPAWLFESGFQLSFSAALIIAGLVTPILERTTEPYRRALRALDDTDLDAALEPRQAQFRLDLRLLIATLGKWSALLQRRPALATAAITVPVRAALWTANIVLFSAVLQIGLILPMAKTFHRVTFAGIGLNALAVPLMTLLLATAVPVVLLGVAAPSIALWPAKVLGFVMQLLFALTSLPRLPSWLSYRLPGPPDWVAWGFTLSLFLAACTLGRSRRFCLASFAGFACFAFLVSVHPFAPDFPRGLVESTTLDCGRGSASFVVLPDGTTLLVNAGGGSAGIFHEYPYERPRWDPGEEIVSPYLWSRGVKRIDVLILTSPQRLQGFSAVAQNFRVGEVWYPAAAGTATPSPATPLGGALDQVRRRGALVRGMAPGAVLLHGGARIEMAWPAGSTGDVSVSTEDPAALRLSAGAASVLFQQGTATQEESSNREGADAATLGSKLVVLGGQTRTFATDPQFLASVQPRMVILEGLSAGSAAAGAGAIEDLRAAGVRVFRTDLDGAVRVEMPLAVATNERKGTMRGGRNAGAVQVHCETRYCGP